MNEKIKDAQTDELFDALQKLKTREEYYCLFEDLCTVSEIKSLALRFQVAKMLREGRTYADIIDKTKASTATISRVNRALEYGADGYRLVLDRFVVETNNNTSEEGTKE